MSTYPMAYGVAMAGKIINGKPVPVDAMIGPGGLHHQMVFIQEDGAPIQPPPARQTNCGWSL